MASDRQRDRDTAAAEGIEDAARKSTIGIVGGSDPVKWTGIGTGVLVRFGGRILILTADHVIGDTHAEDLRFFLPNETPPLNVERSTLRTMRGAPTSLLRPFRKLKIAGILRSKELDLAAVALADSEQSLSPAVVFELADENRDPAEGQTSLVIGFPVDISRVLRKDDTRVVFTAIDWSPVEPPRKGLEGFDESMHFLTKYTMPQSDPDANPHGFSGAARWSRKGGTPGVWHPNLEIIGITTSYYPGSQLLRMVRRSAGNSFLRRIA